MNLASSGPTAGGPGAFRPPQGEAAGLGMLGRFRDVANRLAPMVGSVTCEWTGQRAARPGARLICFRNGIQHSAMAIAYSAARDAYQFGVPPSW